MTRGRLAVLMGKRGPFEFREFDVPHPEPGAMVLKMTAAGICGSDLHIWRGDGALGTDLVPLGHEGAGYIYELGKGVTCDFRGVPLKEGDRVVYSGPIVCGRCEMCLQGNLSRYCFNRQKAVLGKFPYFRSTFADYYYVMPTQAVFKAPAGIPDELLAPVNCAMGTVGMGIEVADVKSGQSVVVMGAGGLGLTAVAMAKARGAYPIIVTDRVQVRLDLAREFGADVAINAAEIPDSRDRVAIVRKETGGLGAHVVMELAGLPDLVVEAVAMLRPTGTVMEIGSFYPGKSVNIDLSTLVGFGKRIVGSSMYNAPSLANTIDFLAHHHEHMPFGKMISHRFGLHEIDHAFQASEWDQKSAEVRRAVLIP
jgi:threonine dehydrogenase-like Zn-dependent dehydrogenase